MMRQNVLYGYIRIGNSRSLFQKLSWFLNKFSPEFAIYLNKDMFKIDKVGNKKVFCIPSKSMAYLSSI